MTLVDNVNLNSMNSFAEQIKNDPPAGRKTQVMEGEWVLAEGGPQFRSTIKFEGGQTVFETDSPTFMGGRGTLPGPMHYCFFGLASCYTAVFASNAAALGVEFKSLTIRVEADVNFSRVFGVSDEPIMEEIRVILRVVSDAPKEKIREAERLALDRCPVMYTLQNKISLSPSLEVAREA
jgi:uncharacterized OsmC-like protein